MSELTLDSSKYFGTVHGQDPHGVAFMQDGLPFDFEGNLVTKAMDAAQRAKVQDVLKERAEAAAKAARQTATQTRQSDNEHVNLDAWLKGDAVYKMHEIAGAMRKRFHVNIASFKDATRFLVQEEGLVPADKLSPDRAADLKD